MIEIKDLLLRFNDILFSEELKKDSIRNTISKVIGVEINSEDIKIKNNSVYLDIKPIYKNEILMKREKIFSELQNVLGKKSPEDIK